MNKNCYVKRHSLACFSYAASSTYPVKNYIWKCIGLACSSHAASQTHPLKITYENAQVWLVRLVLLPRPIPKKFCMKMHRFALFVLCCFLDQSLKNYIWKCEGLACSSHAAPYTHPFWISFMCVCTVLCHSLLTTCLERILLKETNSVQSFAVWNKHVYFIDLVSPIQLLRTQICTKCFLTGQNLILLKRLGGHYQDTVPAQHTLQIRECDE